MGAGTCRALRRARDGGRRAARAAAHPRHGARLAALVSLARLAGVPRGHVRGARRRGGGGSALSRARRVLRRQRHDRAPGGVLRRDGPVPGHDGRRARRLGAGRGSLPRRPRPEHEARRTHLARTHRLRLRADAPRAERGRRPFARARTARSRARARADDRAFRAGPPCLRARRRRRADAGAARRLERT